MGNLAGNEVKAALAKPGSYGDGDGLFLKVSGSRGASWILRVPHKGKRREDGNQVRPRYLSKAVVAERKWFTEMKRFDEQFTALDGPSLPHCLQETDLEGEWPESHSGPVLSHEGAYRRIDAVAEASNGLRFLARAA